MNWAEKYFEYARKNINPKTKILLRLFNIFIFVCFLSIGSYMMWIGNTQLGFDLYILEALYLIFTKLENIDGGY